MKKRKELDSFALKDKGFTFRGYPILGIEKDGKNIFSCNYDSSNCCGAIYLINLKIHKENIKYIKDATKVFFNEFFPTFICVVLNKKKDEKKIKFLKKVGFKEQKQFKNKTKIMLNYRQDE